MVVVFVSFWAKTTDVDPASMNSSGDMRLLIKDTGSASLGDETNRVLLTTGTWSYITKTFTFAAAADYNLSLYFEFGKVDGKIILIDEVHTCDSSRYWLAETYEECMKTTGKPENIDKEFVRLWFRDHCDPYKDETLPDAPKDMLAELSRRYIMLYEMITGEIFDIDALSKRGANINEALEKAMAVKMKQ